MPKFQPWDQRYRENAVDTLPWYVPKLDADFVAALVSLGIKRGRVLDIGCGPGTQAVELAARGFEVVGTDLSKAALVGAAKLAKARGASARFHVDDILHTRLRGGFDLALDRGCLHVLDPGDRAGYAASVTRLLAPGGRLFLKCFSDQEPGTDGPYRLAPADLRALFDGKLEVISIARTFFVGDVDPSPAALCCVLQKPASPTYRERDDALALDVAGEILNSVLDSD